MRKYDSHIIINSERQVSKELGEFLSSKPGTVTDFKIENIQVTQIGTYGHKEAKIFLLIVYSYIE